MVSRRKLRTVLTTLGQGFSVAAAWPLALEMKVVDDCGLPLTQGAVISSFSNGDPPLPMAALRDGTWAATWVPRDSASSVEVP